MASSVNMSISLDRLSASFFKINNPPLSALLPPRTSKEAALSAGGEVRRYSLGVPGVPGCVS